MSEEFFQWEILGIFYKLWEGYETPTENLFFMEGKPCPAKHLIHCKCTFMKKSEDFLQFFSINASGLGKLKKVF